MKSLKKAVALKYPKGVEAPVIVAKGLGKKADKIIEIAEESNVPVEENEGLVDLLGLEDIGDIVPESTWKVIAEIFAFIMENE
mgnify:CR=1 FL=1